MAIVACAFIVGVAVGVFAMRTLIVLGKSLDHAPYNDAQVSYEDRQLSRSNE